MSIIDNLITDRSQSDVDNLRALLARGKANWTSAELAEFNLARSKGAYNYTDLNRVTACMDYLNEDLTGLGYVTGYKPVEVPHQDGSRLPEGYTELEYIESSGTQYIDTGFKPNQDTRVVMHFQRTESYSSINGLFGARDTASGADPHQFIFWNNGQSSFRTDYMGSQETIPGLQSTGDYEVNKDKNITAIGGNTVTNPVASGQSANTLFLFAVNNVGAPGYFTSAKLYSCQIYDNGTIIRDFVPCSNPSGVIGLYDLENEEFYGSASGVAFSAGAAVPIDGARTLQNIIPNSSFEEDADWTGVNYDTSQHLYGERSSRLAGTTVTRSSAVTTPIVGHKYYGRTYLKSTGTIGAADDRFEISAGDGPGLNFVFGHNNGNFPDWTMLSSIQDVTVVNGTSYVVRNFVVSAQNTCWTDGLMILDLTAAFGAGNEPTKEWCDENLPYFSGQYTYIPYRDPHIWYEEDVPTLSAMEAYLANVSALRGVLALGENTPAVPSDMVGLTLAEANAIEQILDAINDYLGAMQAVFLRSGMAWAISGGPNFYFQN